MVMSRRGGADGASSKDRGTTGASSPCSNCSNATASRAKPRAHQGQAKSDQVWISMPHEPTGRSVGPGFQGDAGPARAGFSDGIEVVAPDAVHEYLGDIGRGLVRRHAGLISR